MTKSDFEEGNEVVIRFDSREYSGVVKYNEKVIATHSQRGSQSPPPVQNLESGAAAATAAEHPEVSHNVIESKHYTPKKRQSATKRKGELLSCNTVATSWTLLIMTGSRPLFNTINFMSYLPPV